MGIEKMHLFVLSNEVLIEISKIHREESKRNLEKQSFIPKHGSSDGRAGGCISKGR